MTATPPIGSTWREDYDYGSPEFDRIVEVVGIADDGRVLIRAIATPKRPNPNARVTKARVDRFNKSSGYLPFTGEA